MGPAGGGWSGSAWQAAASQGCLRLLLAGLLLGAVVTTRAQQTIALNTGSCFIKVAYKWTITKTIGNGPSSGTTFSVPRGKSLDLPYTIRIERELAGDPEGTISFTVNCQPLGATAATSVTITTGSAGGVVTQSPLTAPVQKFDNIAWKLGSTPITANTDVKSGTIKATCNYPAPIGAIDSAPADVVFPAANTQVIRATATITDTLTWPNWATWYNGGWLTTPPTVATTQGSYPAQGSTVTASTTYQYTWTISNVQLCFQGAQIVNSATLTAGTGGDQVIYKADASATISVTDCDVKPSFTIDQPNLQTTLTYAWTQSISPLSAAAIAVPWGGGGNIEAQATFTRTVTSATFQASFNLQLGNPSSAPIALTNLQLSCPWGGNVMLPCGGVVNNNYQGQTSLLVIPAAGSVSCLVNNMQLTATWGSDFTQPCTIITSSWLGTQVTFQGLVLNFQAPQRWVTINNCASWTVTCSVPAGNAFYVPTVGGLPTALQVCGSDTSNAPLPPQRLGVAFSGGWIGDGTQPAACASGVSTTCKSELQLQSTAGTTQNYGGTQTGSLTLQVTPIDCPKPVSPPPTQQTTQDVLLPSPSPNTGSFKMVDPVVSAVVTRTVIRGSFTWTISGRLSPANLLISPGPQGVLGKYTVVATPQSVAGAPEPAQYLLEGVVTVTNPDPTASVRVDEVFVVVDNAAVPLGCRPSLPGIMSPGARVDCTFAVNYNQGGNPNTLLGRATVVTDWGVRRSVESPFVRFSFDNSDVSQARGACARVSQSFATNWFDLQQVTGVAPSFDLSTPTTVCGPTTWTFDVRFTTRDNAPCGTQQVVQTVTGVFLQEAQGGTAQSSSLGNLYVAGTGCPAAPADFVIGDTLGPSGSDTTAGTTPATGGSGGSSGTSGGSGGSSSGSGGQLPDAPSGDGTAAGPLPPGVSVVLGDVTSQRSATPNWDVSMVPMADNVTFTRGIPAAVSFKVSWEKTKPATDYSGTITVFNNAAEPAELDAVVVNLLDTLGSGDATDEVQAECPVGSNGALQPVSASSTVTLPANGRLTCNFTLKSASSGSLVGTVTPAAGGDGIVSKPRVVTSLMASSDCSKLATGLAASELSVDGVLRALNGTTEEDACSTGSRIVTVPIPANAKTDRGCVFPVVAIAYMRPQQSSSQSSGVLASAQADVLVAGCSSQFGADVTASVETLNITKGRALRWDVNITTNPAVVNGTFTDSSLSVNTTWQQRSEAGLRLNVSGEVAVTGSAAGAKAQVTLIPFCSLLNATDNSTCSPVTLQANCKAGLSSKDPSICEFNFTRVLNQPGLLLPSVDLALPAAARPYDPARARYGGRPPTLCAVLRSERNLTGPADASTARAVATGATALPTEPFCGQQQSINYTLSFDGIECGTDYNFTAQATATPVEQGATPTSAQLAFNVSC